MPPAGCFRSRCAPGRPIHWPTRRAAGSPPSPTHSAASLTFTYDASGRLGGFVAPGNRVYVYGYDAAGRLTSVTYPDHTVRTYHYENIGFPHALTGITDENGSRFATWGYDGSGRAISSQHAGGAEAVTLYYGSYSSTANEGMTGVTTRSGPPGPITIRSSAAWRASSARPISPGTSSLPSMPTATSRPARDVNRNQTIYAYDLARNLEISRTEAYGTALARTITTQWHPVLRLPTKIVAPSGVGRRQRGDGLRLRRAGQPAAEDDQRGWQDTAMEHDLQRDRPGADGRRAADRRERRHDLHVLRRDRSLQRVPRQREDDRPMRRATSRRSMPTMPTASRPASPIPTAW